MLNLFIAIIVNAMQTFSEREHEETVAVVEHIESDLHAEVRAMRKDIRDLRILLAQGVTAAGTHER